MVMVAKPFGVRVQFRKVYAEQVFHGFSWAAFEKLTIGKYPAIFIQKKNLKPPYRIQPCKLYVTLEGVLNSRQKIKAWPCRTFGSAAAQNGRFRGFHTRTRWLLTFSHLNT
jgi:hypothetical protein